MTAAGDRNFSRVTQDAHSHLESSSPGPQLQIRAATTDDVPMITPLVRDYWRFEGLSGFDDARVSTALALVLSDSRLGAGFVALAGTTPVGYLLAVYVFSLEHLGLTGEVDEFFVVPEYQHRGVGTALLGMGEAAFAEAGCTNASLQLGRHNHAARAFYRRLGYVERDGYDLLDKALNGAAGKG